MSDQQIAEASPEASQFQDRTISCVDCGEQFIWTIGEQVFFNDKGQRPKSRALGNELK